MEILPVRATEHETVSNDKTRTRNDSEKQGID
jgi:hypothetical protein